MRLAADEDLIARCAAELAFAESERCAIAPLTRRFPRLSLEDAYRIQRINVERRQHAGERVVGHKVGLTAQAMQVLFGVREPDYGHLLEPMMHEAARPLKLAELIDPQIEVEPAFVLRRRLAGPGITCDDVLEATEYVSVCFEIIDSRIRDWRIRIQDTVADNGSSARVVLGASRVDPSSVRLDDLETVLELDGKPVASGNTQAILGHPANAVAWLANTLASFGQALEAGHVVLPGTCTRSCRLEGHSGARGYIAGLGEVTVRLASSPPVRGARS